MLASTTGPHTYAFHPMMNSDCSSTLSSISSGYKSLYGDREDLDHEDVRVRTFLFWPKWTPQSLSKESLAKAGLYFTGDDDEVKCFECKVVLRSWKDGDVPLERHRLLSPHCSYLAHMERSRSSDIVVDGDDDDDEDCVDGACRREDRTLQNHCENLVKLPSPCNPLQTKKKNPRRFDKTQLVTENEKLRQAMMCRKCKKERIQTLFLPCRHLVTCEECADKMDDCIQCRQRILGTVRTFMV